MSVIPTGITKQAAQPFVLTAQVGDETTAQTTGTAKWSFRMPVAMTVTRVYACVSTAPTDAAFIVDINDGGTTILSTKITIDATKFTNDQSGTPPVISDDTLAEGALVTIDIDQIGSTVAGAGLKVWLIGTTPTA